MPKLIVALNNPGKEYEGTRHNIGKDSLEELGFFSRLNWKEKFKGAYATHNVGGEQYIFLVPHTYMNLSGESLAPAKQFFKVETDDILVVHDELDLPLGSIAFKSAGGLAGNNGLKSVAQHLGTQDFKRLRIGIGRPIHGSVSSWVLSKFSGDDLIIQEKVLKLAAEAIETYIDKGFSKAASLYSKKTVL